MADIANRTNEIMRKLTLATIILTPYNIFAGMCGMNVRNPWVWTTNPDYDDTGLDYCWPFFSIIIVFTSVSAILLIYVFKFSKTKM